MQTVEKLMFVEFLLNTRHCAEYTIIFNPHKSLLVSVILFPRMKWGLQLNYLSSGDEELSGHGIGKYSTGIDLVCLNITLHIAPCHSSSPPRTPSLSQEVPIWKYSERRVLPCHKLQMIKKMLFLKTLSTFCQDFQVKWINLIILVPIFLANKEKVLWP